MPASARPRLLPALAFLLVLAAGARADDEQTFENQMKRGVTWLEKAQAAYISGDDRSRKTYAKQAEELFIGLSRRFPRDLRPVLLAGQASTFRGDVAKAWRWTEAYKARTPYGENDPNLHYLRAFVHVFAGDRPDRAIQSLNRMYAINPKSEPEKRDRLLYVARIRFGENQMFRRRYENAVKQFQEAARLARRRRWDTKERAALGNAGMTMRVATRWKEAEQVFSRLIERDPDNVLWHWHQGLTLAAQLKFEDAIEKYRAVIELRAKGGVAAAHERDLDGVFLKIGNCYRNLAGGLPEQDPDRKRFFALAKENIERYIGMHPDDPIGHKWLGHLHYPDLEDPYGAVPHFEKAFELDPDCDSSLRSLVQIHARYPAPEIAGESEADYEKRQAAWVARGEALRKDLEEGAERRKQALEAREKKSIEDDDGCE